MANDNNEKRVIINLYMEVPVSEELWWQLREEENDNAILIKMTMANIEYL